MPMISHDLEAQKAYTKKCKKEAKARAKANATETRKNKRRQAAMLKLFFEQVDFEATSMFICKRG